MTQTEKQKTRKYTSKKKKKKKQRRDGNEVKPTAILTQTPR